MRSPTGYKVAPQSYAKLEAIADELRGVLPTTPGSSIRLDCVRILEELLPHAGYKLKVEEVDKVHDCAAFAVPQKQLIVFRADIYDLVHEDHVFGRSTVVHEMSHIVLNHALTLQRGAGAESHRFFEDSEWQAKALTAAIMMPIEACNSIASVADLAEACGTSVESASYRLARLAKDGILRRLPHGLGV
ncbi:hypothetical protein AC731_005405 [Thauera humireducens]|uniref:Uncharacterized protein n=1 Tax=Thauera humireducens TaxID=1134435 RepID=A0A127KAT2_9RHOO|nr:hypothetical protein AC731_005405 [Thauera humireducens]